MSAFSLKKTDRILKRSGFLRLSREGRRIHGEHFVVNYFTNSSGNMRLGVTVSKRVGCAVIRNRIKRLVRECFRLNKARISGACDMNIIAKTGAASLSSRKISQILGNLFYEISEDCKNEAVVGAH